MLDRLISMTSNPGCAQAALRRVRPPRIWGLALLPVLLVPAIPAPAAADASTTERVSVASDGGEANNHSFDGLISDDGRYVAFTSRADNLVPDDTNGESDVFVHDRETGTTVRVSVAADGTEGNNRSTVGGISADGRYITVTSDASNLVSDDTNGQRDVFVHDRDTGVIERVSVATDGTETNSFSTDPVVSDNGRYVAFYSSADNLVPGDTNGANDVFVRDRDTGQTLRVSVASDGSEANGSSNFAAISGDGSFVAFTSDAPNLVADDTNGQRDVFVHDLQSGTTERISLASDGGEGNQSSSIPALSTDGRYIAFASFADNLVPGDTNGSRDIFVRDRQTGTTERVSVASDGTESDAFSGDPTISPDGRFAAFFSSASTLVPGDTNGQGDVFVHDRETEITERVSVATDGIQANDNSSGPALSQGGRYVAFHGGADTLVPGDTNASNDVFVRYRSELVIAPDPLDFGPVIVGETGGPSSVTITNPRLAQITVTEITAPLAPFTAEGGTCGSLPFTLAQGESCELAYSFTPSFAGVYEDSLTLTSDAPDTPHTISLKGLAVEDALEITPGVLDFGGVLPGDTAGPASVTLTNAGVATFEISSLGVPSAPFATAGGTCGEAPFSLEPFESCTLDYNFSPTASGSYSGVIEMTHDAPSGPGGFTLRGEGLARVLEVTPELLTFGNVPLAETGGPLSVTLTNVGELDVTVGEVSDPGAPFEQTVNTCGNVLPPGASCSLGYRFTPTVAESRQAEVTIASDAQSNPHTVTLFGSGTVYGTELISRASGVHGPKGDSVSISGVISSADGRFVSFSSGAELHPDDAYVNTDVYLRDVQTDETHLVSRAGGIDGAGGNSASGGESEVSVSADGRYVAFASHADNLHPDDGDGIADVFVRDMVTHEMLLISRAGGAGGEKGNAFSNAASISADGRFVAFVSRATNLHPDDGDDIADIFVRDLQTQELFLVSRASGADGEKGDNTSFQPSISFDGQRIAFGSGATNLHPDNSNGTVADIYVRDLGTQETLLVSRAAGADGAPGNLQSVEPSISASGLRVAFMSQANNLHPDDDPSNSPNIFVRDLQTQETFLIDRLSGVDGEKHNGISDHPSISANGRYVAFEAITLNLDPDNDTDGLTQHDVFVRDLLNHVTLLASRAGGINGEVGDTRSHLPSITANGRYVAFHSHATNLHPDDSDLTPDVYVRDLLGVAVEPQLKFDPASLDFGEVTVGETSQARTVTLTNVAFDGADVTNLSLLGLPASGFALIANDCGLTLPAGASCQLVLTFTPTALGEAEAILEASSALETLATLSLNGTGVAPAPRIDSDPDSLASTLPQGQTEMRSLTVSNLGELTLDWEVSEGEALTGGILRPVGPVTPVATRPTPALTDGPAALVRPAVTKGAETVASHPFPETGAGDVTLTHSASPQIHSPNSTACLVTADGTTLQNSYLRTFTLTDFGIVGDFGVTSVTFGVESLDTDMTATVNLYTLDGELAYDNLTPIGTATLELAPQELQLVTVSVSGTAPAGSTLVVEIDAPDLRGVGRFLVASNDLGQTAPSYIAALDCGLREPADLADLGIPNMHLVMAVMGTPQSPNCALPGWLGVTPTSGSVGAGDSDLVDVAFDTAALTPGDYRANLCLASNDDDTPLLPVPINLTVTEPDVEEAYTPIALVADPVPFVSDGNGVFEPREVVDVAPWWRNDGNTTQGLTGTASNFSGPAGAAYDLAIEAADYGTLDPGQTAGCLDMEVCYAMGLDDPAVRPANHWDATFDETLDDGDGTTKTWALHIGGSFPDVPATSPFYPAVETLLHSGVTDGCADDRYCPNGVVSRSQLPVFVLRALEGPDYVPQACAEDAEEFSDVPAGSPFCRWIEDLYRRNVVAGCGGGAYCPNDPVSRAQMAIFLLKTLEGDGYTPTECTGRFTDVPCSSLFADWIEDLAAREITGGCSETAFCPAEPVSRAQMAVFLSRAFGLQLYGP